MLSTLRLSLVALVGASLWPANAADPGFAVERSDRVYPPIEPVRKIARDLYRPDGPDGIWFLGNMGFALLVRGYSLPKTDIMVLKPGGRLLLSAKGEGTRSR